MKNYSNQDLIDCKAVKVIDSAKADRWLAGDFDIKPATAPPQTAQEAPDAFWHAVDAMTAKSAMCADVVRQNAERQKRVAKERRRFYLNT